MSDLVLRMNNAQEKRRPDGLGVMATNKEFAMTTLFDRITKIVSVGSIDGVCTTAAVLRLSGRTVSTAVEFCQAFTVDKLDPAGWASGEQVLLVDLAVNNRDPSMTVDFLRRVKSAGHTILGVLDEHNAEDWRKAFDAADLSFDELVIKPVSQNEGGIKSSGALLSGWLYANTDGEHDSHTAALLEAADAGDRMDFTTHFGGLVNQAVKSRITDDSRRVHLAFRFAEHMEPDEKIRGWIAEYETILQNHEAILAAKQDLGDGIHRVVTTAKTVDVTTLMSQLYKNGARVVVMEAEMFDKSLGQKTRQIAFGTGEKLDLLAAVKAAVPTASGFAQKANVPTESEEAALAAVRTLLRG